MIIDQLLLLYYYYYRIIIIIISVIIAIIRILLLLWASCDLYNKKTYRSVNVRHEPALHCKGPQILGQCLTNNISSGHPRSVCGCGI